MDSDIVHPYSEEEMNWSKKSGYLTSNTLKDEFKKFRPNCFIATTVYGDINAPEVRTLRDFRDNVLMKKKVGRVVVKAYYSGVGKKTAKLIGKIPCSIPVIKKGLDYLVQQHQQSEDTK